jgi:signal transduction histidine kinase
MKRLHWSSVGKVLRLLRADTPASGVELARIQTMERNIGLPVRAGLIAVLIYYFFFSRWLTETTSLPDIALEYIRRFFLLYLSFNLAASVMLVKANRASVWFIRWVVFTLSLLDGLLLAALVIATGGFDSMLYWLFLGLIVRNAISVPVAMPQIVLNLCLCGCYLLAGVLDIAIFNFESGNDEAAPLLPAPGAVAPQTEPFLLRLFLLLLMTACCYGVQVLYDRHRRLLDEARESNARQEQLQTAGRMAAQIAHQLKNPLAIINNAAFNLQQTAPAGDGPAASQLQIIREEVARADDIITRIMGYGQLAEGRVERVELDVELDRALAEVFPPALASGVEIRRQIAPGLPPLFIQRRHFNEMMVNLLQNAREAVQGRGTVELVARPTAEDSVILSVADSGPGIPPERREIIFEPYYTTKEKGTGLGLAIVRHTAQLYGGVVRVESGLGNGARFTVEFPLHTANRPAA